MTAAPPQVGKRPMEITEVPSFVPKRPQVKSLGRKSDIGLSKKKKAVAGRTTVSLEKRPSSWANKVQPLNSVKRTRKAGPMSKLKKELDRVFSLYIRAKYGPNCYTCDSERGTQNGHFVIRQYLFTRWEEDNCRPQGFGCNIRRKGNTIEFEERLKKELGDTRVEELKASRKILVKMTEEVYRERIAYFKDLINSQTPATTDEGFAQGGSTQSSEGVC